MLLAAADMPPTPPPAATAAAPTAATPSVPVRTTELVVGLGNPEWLHLGVASRYGNVGYAITVGTLVQANNITGAFRYFPWADGGAYLEAGATMIRMTTLSDQSPQEWSSMALLGAGYQISFGRVTTTLGVGLNPIAMPYALNQPLFVTNARSVPRLLIQTGFAL